MHTESAYVLYTEVGGFVKDFIGKMCIAQNAFLINTTEEHRIPNSNFEFRHHKRVPEHLWKIPREDFRLHQPLLCIHYISAPLVFV